MLQPAAPICQAARDAGLIVITAGKGDVIRLVPPLTVRHADPDFVIGMSLLCSGIFMARLKHLVRQSSADQTACQAHIGAVWIDDSAALKHLNCTVSAAPIAWFCGRR